ncbi:conserved protein, unknown function, partial [Hepatocystis sp. ex Piliocolobus tephrosceles]
GETEKAHANICLMLRNENVCQICKQLILLCNRFSSFLFYNETNSNNESELKKYIRNILYCSNKLDISNKECLRSNFIKHFGKKCIELIENDFLLLDKTMCTIINKYMYSSKEIREVENAFLYDMGYSMNNKKEQCVCDVCAYVEDNYDYTLHLKKKDILELVSTYSRCSEDIHDNEQKEILMQIETKLISNLNKYLLGK